MPDDKDDCRCDEDPKAAYVCKHIVERKVQAATARERERAARVAEDWDEPGPPRLLSSIAAAIRGRECEVMKTVDERVADAVWKAVEAADDAGWDYRRFKVEVTDAWRECLKRGVQRKMGELEE